MNPSQSQPPYRSPSDIHRAAQLLREGGLVAFATETVYGLGANALDPVAVSRIFEVKKRPSFDPLIVHIADIRQLEQLATDFPTKARRLADRFWPGPLTIVLPKTDIVPDIVTSGLPTVAIRIPSHPAALELLRLADVPVAAPSANLFGSVSPTCADHVRRQLGDSVDCIVDGGDCSVGVESTILSFAADPPAILRFGGLAQEQIEAVIGAVAVADHTETCPSSPGRLEHHYATETPLLLLDSIPLPPKDKRAGLLALQAPTGVQGFAAVEELSADGDLAQAATRLFAAMRRLDALDLDMIYATIVPNRGIGRAVNDRLYRASRNKPRLEYT